MAVNTDIHSQITEEATGKTRFESRKKIDTLVKQEVATCKTRVESRENYDALVKPKR